MMDKNQKKRILIVDDSKVIARILKLIIDSTSDLEVVGIATNGKEAVLMTQQLHPDLITMDIIMPEMNGFEATKSIMNTCPTPIVIISSHVNDKELNATFRALQEGALTIINKPINIHDSTFLPFKNFIIETVRNLSTVKMQPHPIKRTPPPLKITDIQPIKNRPYQIVALGASTGGPSVVKEILSSLPIDFPLPIVVVQHIAPGFITGFSEWLNSEIGLHVTVAEHNETLDPAHVYIAPDDHHLTVKQGSGRLYACLTDDDPVEGFRPAINPLFLSLAQTCAAQSIAGLLTGMGKDGAEGMKALHDAKAHTFIQDKKSAIIYSMPHSALQLDAVNSIVKLPDIANYLTQLIVKNQ